MKLQADLKYIAEHTKAAWDVLRGQTIFLTGGTGFFGKWLLESFVYANETMSLGCRMIVLSRDPEKFLSDYPGFRKEYIRYISGDVRSFEFPEDEIGYVLHTASDVSPTLNVEQPLLMFDTIVSGTRRVLELAKEKKVKAVLHTSSGAVYGKQPHDITHIKEDFIGAQDVYDKGAAYGEGKRVAEMMANLYYLTYGIESKVARCFAFVGPYLPLDIHFAIGNFIRDVIKGEQIIIRGDGTPYRSYLYASDLAVWLWSILVFGKSCRPYNVGSDVDLPIGQLAYTVASVANKGSESVSILTPPSGAPAARYVPDIERARVELGLKVGVGLEEAIRKTIDYHC
jgi:nucleoside-diphosphate-sugar epimerase